MSDTDEDLALETLLSVRLESSSKLSEDLLRKCYIIQRRHQYSDDRTQSVSALERLIDLYVDEISGENSR